MGLLDDLNPIGLITDGIKAVGDILDEAFTSDDERATAKNILLQVQNEMTSKMLQFQTKMAEFQSNVIMSEATGESWLQRNWRPLVMLEFAFIILYIVVSPALGLPPVDMKAVPDKMWTLLTVGIGGYIGGRSIEKGIKEWKNKKGGAG